MGEDGGGGEGVGKLAAGNVAEEWLLARAVDNERGQGNGGTLWRILSSRSLTGSSIKGMERTMIAMSLVAPRASSCGAWPESNGGCLKRVKSLARWRR